MASSTQSTLSRDQRFSVDSAAATLFENLTYTDGSSVCALRSGEFSDTELYVEESAATAPTLVEDDGCLHYTHGHFRLACFVGEDGTSGRRSVQRRFQRACEQVFAQHGDQFRSLLS